MLVHRSMAPSTAAGGQSPFQHLAWPGTGVGWRAPGPLFVSKMAFLLLLWILFLSQLGSVAGASISWHHLCERSASVLLLICAAPLSSDPFLPCKGNS